MGAVEENDDPISFLAPSSRRPPQPSSPGQNQVETPATDNGYRQRRKHHRDIQRLGHYDIVSTLGEGSFGKVKLAIHQGSGQKVALKIISRKKLQTSDMAGRIEREIQYLQLLRHPHIIKLFTVVTTATSIIMVLEYAGEELFDYIVRHGRMKEDMARRFFQQIICAVEYCHRHRIVHRDLKPENLLLGENLNVKIADFGLSNIIADGNFLQTSCGSPNYAAPEVISGKLYAGPEVDVWSCGVILYVLLCGRLPFDDEYIPALFKKIGQGKFVLPDYLSEGAKRMISSMLIVNPMQRITISSIRRDEWFLKDLPSYLQLPADHIGQTGFNHRKAIDPLAIDPTLTDEAAREIHERVVQKLQTTMSHSKADIEDALRRDEPSGAKDAYLIVRENLLMKENSIYPNEASTPILGPSHPVGSVPSDPLHDPARAQSVTSPNPSASEQVRGSGVLYDNPMLPVNPTRVSVLPSSLPAFHSAFVLDQPYVNDAVKQEAADLVEMMAAEDPTQDGQEPSRRLKPHTRSIEKKRAGTSSASKKNRPTKWQFGIRSRNAPAEAMLAIYKALKALGAEWQVPKYRRPDLEDHQPEGAPESMAFEASDDDFERTDDEDDDRLEVDRDDEGETGGDGGDVGDDESTDKSANASSGLSRMFSRSSQGQRNARVRYGVENDWGYKVPENPWVIQARFRKDGVLPPGVLSLGAAKGEGTKTEFGGEAEPNNSLYIYLTIQLFSIEPDFYLVDFKCAGYERLVKDVVMEIQRKTESDLSTTGAAGEWQVQGVVASSDDGLALSLAPPMTEEENRPILEDSDYESSDSEGEFGIDAPGMPVSAPGSPPGSPVRRLRIDERHGGRAAEEKRAMSPFPFLDVVGRLIVQLAEGR